MLLFQLSYWKLQTSAVMQIFKWYPMKRLLVVLKRNHICLTYFDQKWYFWELWTCFCNGSVLPWSIMGCCFLWPHYQASQWAKTRKKVEQQLLFYEYFTWLFIVKSRELTFFDAKKFFIFCIWGNLVYFSGFLAHIIQHNLETQKKASVKTSQIH